MDRKIKVCIDPGHAAGSDKSGCNGFSEQRHNLAMSRALKQYLEATGGFECILTRNDEKSDPSLTTRGRMAKGFDVFISMHTNGANGRARGVTIFISVDLPGNQGLAKAMLAEVTEALGLKARGVATRASEKYFSKADPSVKEDYYTVIDSAQDSGCPYVLLTETGFHDNIEDWKIINPPEGIDKIARAYAKVLCEKFGVQFEPGKPPAEPPTNPPQPPKPPAPPSTETVYILHKVVKGDNPSKLAERFHTTAKVIMELNNIKDATRIQVGSILKIPTQKKVERLIFDGTKTLYTIGKEHGIDWRTITYENGEPVDQFNMHKGDVILVPVK